jgi:tetratricopeptide (TPR) repeat protein
MEKHAPGCIFKIYTPLSSQFELKFLYLYLATFGKILRCVHYLDNIMLKILTVFISIFFGSSLFCQTDYTLTYKVGIQYQRNKDCSNAIVQYDSVINGCKDYALLKMSYIFKSQCLKQFGQYESSLESINKAIEIDKEDIASYFDKIHILEELERYSEVANLCEQILKMTPSKKQESYCYYYLGKVYTTEGEFKKAIEYYDKSLNLVDTDYQIYYYRGFAYEKLKKIDESINDYTKSIELKSDFANAYERRGQVRIQKILHDNEGTYISVYGKDACADLNKAKELGLTSAQEWLDLYCK